MPVLDQIITTTRLTLPALHVRRAALEAAADQASAPRDFTAALRGPQVRLIAEVKRRSPSAGAINPGLDPLTLASAYQGGGAAAISVLTDGPFFGGSLDDLTGVAGAVTLPLLRKDFLLDPLQLVEARAAGASAVLLIVRVLTQATLRDLLQVAAGLGMAALVEIHNAAELERALDAGATIIGVNARDLDSFTIDCPAAWALLGRIPPECIAVAESGMATRADVEAAAAAGADAVLIGGALAAAVSPAELARQLSSVVRRGR